MSPTTATRTADPTMPEGRAEMIRRMKETIGLFDSFALLSGCYALLEFAELMSDFVALCIEAEQRGIDWPQASRRSGIRLPLEPFHVACIEARLKRIYDEDLELRIKRAP